MGSFAVIYRFPSYKNVTLVILLKLVKFIVDQVGAKICTQILSKLCEFFGIHKYFQSNYFGLGFTWQPFGHH